MSDSVLAPRQGPGLGQLIRRPEVGSLFGLVVVYIFFAVMGGENFRGPPGISAILNFGSVVGIIALAIGLLMIAGELDLSVGAVVPASMLTLSIVANDFGFSVWGGILAALLVGLGVGFANGILVLRTGIPSLIITIGTFFGVKGLLLGLTVLIHGSTGVFLVPDEVTKALFGQMIDNRYQVSIIWWVIFAVVIGFFLHYSPWGNGVYALGGDKESARNAGVATGRLTIQLYMLSGFCAASVGIMQVLTFNAGQVAAGRSFIFDSIMCVVIGGVLMTGGAGSVVGVVLGTLTFAIVNQGIFFSGLDPNFGSIIIGALLLIAVLSNDKFRALAMAYAAGKRT